MYIFSIGEMNCHLVLCLLVYDFLVMETRESKEYMECVEEYNLLKL